MTWGVAAVATVAGSAISGYMGAQAAESAANTQAAAARDAASAQLQASRESNQLQREMYLSNLGLQRPNIQAGQVALAALTGGLGLNVNYGRPLPGAGTGSPMAGGTTGPTYMNSQGQTVDAQGNVIQQTSPGMPDMSQYGATPEEMQQAAGKFSGQFTQTFKPSDLTMDPSYQFRLNQGLRAIQARGAATGMLQTGQGLRDISDYAQESASQEYGNAYNRFMRNQETLYNRLAGIAGVGQTATGAVGAAGQTAATNIGQTTVGGARAASDYLTGGAAASAAGRVGASQAYSGAFNQGVNNWVSLQYLNKMTPQQNVLPGGVGNPY